MPHPRLHGQTGSTSPYLSLNALSHKSFLPSFSSEVHLCALLNVCQSLSRAICLRQWGWFNLSKACSYGGQAHRAQSTFVGAGKETPWAPWGAAACCRVAGSVHRCSPRVLLPPSAPPTPTALLHWTLLPRVLFCFLGLLKVGQYVGVLFSRTVLIKTIKKKMVSWLFPHGLGFVHRFIAHL